MKHTYYLVIGLGQTGLSIARYLSRRNKPFVVYDTRSNPSAAAEFKYDFPGVDLFLGELPESVYEMLLGVICSPGVPLETPIIARAKALNIPVFGDIDCLADEIDAPVIAITGTNGKSTVTTLVGEMGKAAGFNTAVAGNIGLPVLDILDVGVKYDLWVLELSSFQLDLTHRLKPRAATILNITPDHLDRHHQFSAYAASKHRIYKESDWIIYNRDDTHTYPVGSALQSKPSISFGSDNPTEGWGLTVLGDSTYLAKGNEPLISVQDLKIRGRHNWLNAMAACALAETVGIDTQVMVDVLKRFAGLPHRSQWVRTLNQVDWINDSKATNVGATISAIAGIGGAMKGKLILIAGGQGKGAEFNDLQGPMALYVRAVILIGQDAPLIEKIIPKGVNIVRAHSMDDAVSKAEQAANPGDVVLLSPACASFDMFRDFNHRGDDFMAAVQGLGA